MSEQNKIHAKQGAYNSTCSDLNWIEGPVRGGVGTAGRDKWWDGDVLLVLTQSKIQEDDDHYDIDLIRINCDEDYFYITDCMKDEDWGWEESDIHWWAKVDGFPDIPSFL